MDQPNRVHFKRWLKKSISFRTHMTFIMFSTIFLGIVSNFIMFRFMDLTNPIGRYPLIVLFSYGSFLIIIRYYIKNILFRSLTDEAVELADFADDCPTGVSNLDLVSTVNSDSGFGFGDLGDADGEAVMGLVLLAAITAIIFGSGVYFIWHSPEILSECLLQVFLVSGMGKRMRKFSEAEWSSHILKTTLLPFFAVLILSLILGLYLRSTCSEVTNFQEYKTRCGRER